MESKEPGFFRGSSGWEWDIWTINVVCGKCFFQDGSWGGWETF